MQNTANNTAGVILVISVWLERQWDLLGGSQNAYAK